MAYPLIYIAGPYRGPDAWAIEENIRHAERYGLLVAHLGAMPVIPHSNCRYFHGQCDEQFWVDGTLRLLEVCDAAVFIPGWPNSRGSRSEWDAMESWGRRDARFDFNHINLAGAIEQHAKQHTPFGVINSLKVFIEARRRVREAGAAGPA